MLYIGIDPGVNTGFAVWDSSRREFVEVSSLRIDQALERTLDIFRADPLVKVIFEDARQRKFFEKEKNLSEYRGKLMGAGSVKRDSTIWADFLEAHHISYWAKPPQKGATKLSAERFAALTRWTKRTNEHARDAAMLVFGVY